MSKRIIKKCKTLLAAYKAGDLGPCPMPEESNPGFSKKDQEARLSYFTLPMVLNYQRDSYKLWEAALKTYENADTKGVFDVKTAAKLSKKELQKSLLKYKLALQPNKHIETWHTLSKTIAANWGSLNGLMQAAEFDFLKLKAIVQETHKKGFPYLSGPKIFNYWSFILMTYGGVNLKNADQIEIAPDTHITQCSVVLGVITENESRTLSRDQISARWRDLLKDSEIIPIEMHPPLWFWSRGGFTFTLK